MRPTLYGAPNYLIVKTKISICKVLFECHSRNGMIRVSHSEIFWRGAPPPSFGPPFTKGMGLGLVYEGGLGDITQVWVIAVAWGYYPSAQGKKGGGGVSPAVKIIEKCREVSYLVVKFHQTT